MGARNAVSRTIKVDRQYVESVSEEELASAENYTDFVIEFIPGERERRKFETKFEALTDPTTATPKYSS